MKQSTTYATFVNQPHIDLEATLGEISTRARQFARRFVAADVADHVAQDVVLECLMKINAGEWNADRSTVGALVRRMVRRRAVDHLRQSQRRAAREAEHAREVNESARAWMSPELSYEEDELAELQRRALGDIPQVCRRAYIMVREEEATYEVAASRLGVTRNTVASHVVRAQRRLRQALTDHGIGAQPAEARSSFRDARRIRTRFH